LTALSTASEPAVVKNTAASLIGASALIRSASSRAGRVAKRSYAEYASSRPSCSAAAAASSRRPCPTFAYQRLPDASRYRLPSVS
jgi:hypothetical protein